MGLLDKLGNTIQQLVDAGYPESVAARIASGELPMDQPSRMARAADQGYNMTPQYHGSQSDILEFRPSSDGKMGAGVYTSDNPEVANRYATGNSGDNITPVLLRGDSINRRDAIAANPDMRREQGETNREMFQRLADIVQGGGYGRMDIGGPDQGNMIRESVTYNPENVRSLLSAAFDPEYSGKNILGLSGGSHGVSGRVVDAASTAAQNAGIDYALSRAPDLGTIEPVEQGYRDTARDYIAEALGGDRGDYRMAEKLLSVADYLPFLGGGTGAADTVDAYNEGDVLGTVLGAGGVLAGMLPAGKAAYDGLLGIIEQAPRVTRDTKLLQRVGDPKSVNAMQLDVEQGQDLAPARLLSAADLEGRGFVSGMADTSRGDLSRVVGVNGLPVDMTRYGGQDYMRQLQNLEQGILWASDQGQITGLLNAAKAASELDGVSRSPLYIPYQMGATSTDFSTMTSDLMVPVARQNMNKADKKALDKRIREGAGNKKNEFKPQPDWPGIDSPNADEWLLKAGGNRKAITKAIDEFRDVAGINLSQTRAAIVDPNQMNPRVGNLLQAGALDLSRLPQAGMHPSYNTDLMGYYLGQFGEGANLLEHLNPLIRSSGEPFVPAMLARGHNLSAEKLPSPVGKAMQAGLIGRFDTQTIDELIKQGLVAP